MKLIIADGNCITRIGLKSIFSELKSVEKINEADSSAELLKLAKSNQSDLLLIDYTSDEFCIDIIPKVLHQNPGLKVLAITPAQSAQTLIDALRSGVCSYVKKNCSISEIIEAAEETMKGKKFFCGQILETIQRASINVDDIDLDMNFTCDPVVLTDREIQIIKLIADGLTNIQIAEQLYLSNHTVNTHRKNILSKLGVKNTAGIVMYAVKTELVSPNKFLFAAE